MLISIDIADGGCARLVLLVRRGRVRRESMDKVEVCGHGEEE